MLINRIIGWTRDLCKPADWDESKGSCGSLPIRDCVIGDLQFMVSSWEPTPEELKRLNEGKPVLLGINGTIHPVVFLSVDGE